MYVVTYLLTENQKTDPSVLFFNNDDELKNYKKVMGARPITGLGLINLFEECDGFKCIISKI